MIMERFGYLVTNIAAPGEDDSFVSYKTTKTGKVRREHYLQAARQALGRIDCNLKLVYLASDEPVRSFREASIQSRRHLIVIRDGVEDDDFAEIVSDSLQGALLLSTGFLPFEEPIYLIKVPLGFVNYAGRLDESDLTNFHENEVRYFDFQIEHNILHQCFNPMVSQLRRMFRLVPMLVNEPELLLSTGFLVMSYRDFQVSNPVDVLSESRAVPLTRFYKCALENALHNAYKSIEALIGEPPKDIRNDKKRQKLFRNLRYWGFNPEETITRYDPAKGTYYKQPFFELIAEFAVCRDSMIAHGSTARSKRALPLLMTFEYQQCASILLHTAVEHTLKNQPKMS